MATLKESLSAGVATYTGFPVAELEIYPDPKVSGTYALRAVVTRTHGTPLRIDFLLVGGNVDGALRNADAETVAENLEETDFASWPPKSGALRFF